MNGAEISNFDPIVSFCETLLKFSHTVMSKSPNKQNRLYVKAKPMEEALAEAIVDGKMNQGKTPKTVRKVLFNEFGWHKELSKKKNQTFIYNKSTKSKIDRC
ncbi:unnamed protein product [Vicia faba]|uniref:Uncharacterized protein n=1 Tax=Vicia faba TaxID=3906 RepID=A0AAV0ZC86_VICFA|nr:unnamed protein product [Vicia faba]